MQEGNSRKQSVVRLKGSLELLDQLKIALESKFYDRLITAIEKQSGQILDQQFTVSWDVIETEMEKATGKDSVIMLTEDWFSSHDRKVGGRTIDSAVNHINKYFFKYPSSTPRVVKDKKTGTEMSSVLGDRCGLYDLIWNWVVKAIPEHGMMEIKECMRKMVTEQRNNPTG